MFALAFLCTLAAFASASPISRIVNGTDAKPGEIPYIISLRNSGSHSCGGSILDELHVLTAAHCIDFANAKNLKIQYGVLDIGSQDNIVQVAVIHKHEGFDRGKGTANDVAVLTLESPIALGDNVKPITLPEQDEAPPGGDDAVLAGWGLNRSGGSIQKKLQRVDLLVYTDEDCSAAHGSSVNATSQVCSGIPEGGKGQCSGDSGGPLVAHGKQIGVVSWSVKPCAVAGYPGVFSRVATYVDWIKDKAGL